MGLPSPFPASLRRVYWETTAGCNLRCIHCRRTDVLAKGAPDELTTAEGLGLIDDLAALGKPVLIFSGGEPLFRRDLFELMAHARAKGLPLALATNGTLVSERIAGRLREAGVYYASISLDGATPQVHDAFRGPGNFQRALDGMRRMQEAGIKVQVNFTVTRLNVHEVEAMYRLAGEAGAAALYLFLLVPVGCGVEIADSQMLSPGEVEDWLGWVDEKERGGGLPVKAICAPHFFRIQYERNPSVDSPDQDRKGCLAGIHMCFVSHKGEVFPCGYLPVSAGSVRTTPFARIWSDSPVFRLLRDPALLTGRCGACHFARVCGGCRARAWHAYDDLLAEEPACAYEPARRQPRLAGG